MSKKMSQFDTFRLHSQLTVTFFLLLHLPLLPAASPLHIPPDPDPEPVQPQKQNLLRVPTTTNTPSLQSPATTIPSFPEQSAVAGCPLNLPDELFAAVRSSCIATPAGKKRKRNNNNREIHRGRCCPVLAAWLYWAYSETALVGGGPGPSPTAPTTTTTPYEMMPLLPDDSETCVDGVERVMRDKGLELRKVNETCDVVYCYCGIRLHTLSCPAAFRVSEKGKMVGDQRVSKLEADCSLGRGGGGGGRRGVGGGHGGGGARLAGCSNCLHSLYQLREVEGGSTGKMEDKRTSKMRSRECEMMGLTWLLAKNRTAYIDTVTLVLRAMMMSPDGSEPRSCRLNSDVIPLAVDSTEITFQSSASTLQCLLYLLSFSSCLLWSLLLMLNVT